MGKSINRLVLPVVAVMVSLGLAVAPAPGWSGKAVAAEDQQQRPKKRTRKVETLSQKAYKKLEKAQEALQAEDYPATLKAVDEILNRPRGYKAYDLAMAHQLKGYVYSSQEKYGLAVKEFEELLRIGGDKIPEGVINSTLYNMSQLYMATENFKKGVETLKRWFKIAINPSPDAHILMAQGYAQMDQYKQAVPWVEKAISLVKAKGKTPRENWYQLLLALRFELKDYPQAAKVLETLLSLYPSRNYWLQLSAIYGELGRELDQLAAMRAAYQQGLLYKNSELVNLAQLFLYHGVPINAAKVMKKGLDSGRIESTKNNWELLANSYINAQEISRSIAPLRKAASLSKDGELYVRLGQAFMEQEKWGKAAQAFSMALKKGKLRRPGTAYLLSGMARYHQKQFKAARAAFKKAASFKKTAKTGKQWLKFLAQEERKHKLRRQ